MEPVIPGRAHQSEDQVRMGLDLSDFNYVHGHERFQLLTMCVFVKIVLCRDTMKRVLSLPADTIMEYKTHNDALKDNSSFRNTDVFR